MERGKKTVLITGGTSGIGYELAKIFAADMYNLVLVSRNEKELLVKASEFKRLYDVEVYTIAKDLIQFESPFEVYEEIKEKGIEVNILVNNAGQGEYGKFSETDIYRELDIIQLNIGSTIKLTKMFLQDMLIRNEGKILNVGSIAGEAPGPWHSVYHGTKAFINSWSEGIRNELQNTNITVTVLLPGATNTDFFNKANMENSRIMNTGLSDPATVAKDGYKALMAGESKIISGLKNKAQVAMAKVLPDAMAAENINKQQQPKNEQ